MCACNHCISNTNQNQIKMRRTTISNLRQFMLALLLPAVAIAAGLQSCNDEGPGIPSEETAQVKSSGNPLMRSPEEALEIAQRAYEEFYGDGTPSSRGRSIIDCSRPVEVVRGARSRGGGSDTLLYIVNFVDDQGFAVIAAPRAADELLAVTSQGHYYPESNPDAESVPGFDLWMAAAGDYAASVALPRDTTFYPPIDTNLIVKRDTLVTPVNPGGNPPVTLDSTRIINPDDPVMLQQKEWNDTTFRVVVDRQLPGTWGQGIGVSQDLKEYPEAYYFWNGRCGCVTVAIAQICAFYQEPSRIYLIRPGVGQLYTLDWSKMRLHKAYDGLKRDGNCDNEEIDVSHMMIANFCKAIADRSDANVSQKSTGISPTKALATLKSLLSKNISEDWMSYTTEEYPLRGQLLLMRGSAYDNEAKKNAGHEWVCDGTRYFKFDHYFATRRNNQEQWQVQSKTSAQTLFVHYNWGWYGLDNGWFNQAVISLENVTIYNFQYVKIN